jgi:hypothetical protein
LPVWQDWSNGMKKGGEKRESMEIFPIWLILQEDKRARIKHNIVFLGLQKRNFISHMKRYMTKE